MASLTGSTIASSYEQLLSLPDGGLNGNTLVAITDGDSSTAIGMKVATSKIEVIPASDDANAFEVSQADGTAVFTVNTSSPAFTLTGNATITTADNTDTLKLISTDADASVGPSLNFYRNSGSPADSDNIGILKATGRNDNSQDVDYVLNYNSIGDASDGTEDGRFETYVMLAGTARSRVKMDETETIFNNDSVDLDFRVESNGNANMLFVDGGTNRVGIATATPGSTFASFAGGGSDGILEIAGISSHGILGISKTTTADNDDVGVIAFCNTGNSNGGAGTRPAIAGIAAFTETDDSNAGADSGGHLTFWTKAGGTDSVQTEWTEKMRITSAGNVGIGQNPEVIHTNYPTIRLGSSGTVQGGGGMVVGSGFYTNASDGWASNDGNAGSMLSFSGANMIFYNWDNSASTGGSLTLATPMIIKDTGFVGIGDSSPDAHLDVEDDAVDSAVDYYGIMSNHTKTAGASDSGDTFCGTFSSLTFNDADAGYSNCIGLDARVFGQNSTGENTGLFAVDANTRFDAGDINDAYGIRTIVDINGGTVDDSAYGQYVNVDVEGGVSGIQNIIGHYLKMDCGSNPSSHATGYYLFAMANMDYAARYYDNVNSTYRVHIGALSGDIDAEGSISASQSLDYAEYFESSDGSVISHGTTVKLDGDKIVACEEGDTPLGIIRPKTAQTIVGGSQVFHWAEKFMKDDYGADIMEDYTESKWSEEITYDEYVARGKDETGGVEGGIVTDSKVEGSKAIEAKDAVEAVEAQDAVYETVTKQRQKVVVSEVEEEVSSTEIVLEDGKYVQKTTTKTITKEVETPQYEEVTLYDEDGEEIGTHQVQIMEDYEEEQLVSEAVIEVVGIAAVEAVDAVPDTYFREHKYHSDRLPDGVTAPDDAETITPGNQRQKVNPDYDSEREYSSREERDEWHVVGLLGQIPITKGQPVADNWTKMKDVSDTVEMYFVK